MKKYRRIEITAFRRRISLVSGKPRVDPPTDGNICTDDADAQESIEPESDEVEEVLIKEIRLLEERLSE